MTQKSLKMTRDKLAEFLPDHESIRKFEELLAIGDSLTQTTIFELLLNSSIAELPKPNQFTTADFIDFRANQQIKQEDCAGMQTITLYQLATLMG